MVVTALDDVLGLSVDLQLRDESLDHVSLVVAGLFREGDRLHGSVLEFNFEELVAHLHWLVFEFGARDYAVPSIRQFTINASVLSILEFHLESVAIMRANGEFGLHENSGPLILKIRQSGECAGAD